MRNRVLCCLPLILSLASQSALAQDAFSSPSKEDIERARKTFAFPDKVQLDKTMREQAEKSAEVVRKTESSFTGMDKPVMQNAMPKVEVNGGAGTNLEDIAKKYYSGFKAPKPGGEAELMVFITLAMPKESLLRLMDQSEKIGAVMVLRGLKGGSFKKTTSEVMELTGNRKVSWQINPPAFKRFDVKRAPTFVIAKAEPGFPSNTDGCAPSGSFVAVEGDVSLDYALEVISRGSQEFAPIAEKHLKQIRAGS